MIGDYKHWIQCKADEIALERYDCGFYELSDNTQETIYSEAMDAYKDALAGEIDAARERSKYGKLLGPRVILVPSGSIEMSQVFWRVWTVDNAWGENSKPSPKEYRHIIGGYYLKRRG